jgi:nucleoside-diphosphate-sugar epimerase
VRSGGHEVRLLVRSPDRIAPALGPLGVDGVDHVVGSVTDAEAVSRALDGCDAVLHAANVYTFDSRQAKEMLDVNVRGTELVLRGAAERGLDPIVHVSSGVALLPPAGDVLTPDSPLGAPPGAYARSKVAAERVARDMQAEGAPVVITNPGTVVGPDDPGLSDSTRLVRDVVRGLIPLAPRGSVPFVDVRDVAAVHAALFEPGRGARRYLVMAENLSLEDLIATARRVTGRRLPSVRIPGRVALAVGRATDVAQRVLPVRLPISFEGPWILITDAHADASATERELGVHLRPSEEAIADTIRWLWRAGRISRRHAGRLAEEADAS